MKKFLFIAIALAASVMTHGQVGTFLSSYNLSSDTVVNAGTTYMQSGPLTSAPATTTTIWVSAVKNSGTVGGTITLQGSLDGTNYKAINTVGTQTALATITATDATNTYHWILQGSPFTYYRVSWVGTGTMSATVRANIFRAKP